MRGGCLVCRLYVFLLLLLLFLSFRLGGAVVVAAGPENSQSSCVNVAEAEEDGHNMQQCETKTNTATTTIISPSDCMDQHKNCEKWADEGKCIEKDPSSYMQTHCAKACGKCRDTNHDKKYHAPQLSLYDDDNNNNNNNMDYIEELCEDEDELCNFWAEEGECDENPNYMHSHCSKSCGTCRKSAPFTEWYGERQLFSKHDDKAKTHVKKMHTYMTEVIFVEEKYANVRDGCRNNNPDCVFWAVLGECVNKPAFMLTECAPACLACEMVDFNTRCPSDKNAPKFLQQPGDLHKFFLNLMVKALERSYTPAILSAPAIFFQNEIHNNATLASIQMAENVIRDGPWIVTLDDIFSEVECDRLIELGALRGYSRSTDVGELKPDGTIGEYLNPRRTSTNAWCVDDCYDDEQVQVMHARIEELTGIPNNHSEYWQLLKYEKTQEYMQHHDYIEEPFERAPGVRILTIFLYLNNVEAGGGTHFNILNITVTPKRGQVVIWPSVLDESPDEKDSRTDHQALPIEEGIKYGANAWVHQRDFKTPMIFNCA